MQNVNIIEKIGGTTLKGTLVNSGVTPDDCWSVLRDASEALVNSVSAVSSGAGFYYAVHALPNSNCWLVNEWNQRIGVNTYTERQFVKVFKPEVG